MSRELATLPSMRADATSNRHQRLKRFTAKADCIVDRCDELVEY
jgi:hypothetical protein